jgi:hypothetical protein
MIGKKKLSDVRRELTELLERLPKEPPGSWLEREIQAAEGQPDRDVETLRMLQSALRRSRKEKGAVPTPTVPVGNQDLPEPAHAF